MRNLYYETTLHKQIRDKRTDRKERIGKDIDNYGSDILVSDELKEAYPEYNIQIRPDVDVSD